MPILVYVCEYCGNRAEVIAPRYKETRLCPKCGRDSMKVTSSVPAKMQRGRGKWHDE